MIYFYHIKGTVEHAVKITLLLPMYNESNIIKDTLTTVSAYMKKEFSDGYEILVVNDGSRDGCADTVRGFPDPCVRLISYEENRGKGYAIRCGVKEALGEVIMFTDCDLAYGTEVIREFYDALGESGAGVAVGSRPKHKDGYAGYTPMRKLVSRTYLWVLRLFGGLHLSDSQCGCKAFTARAAKEIFSRCEVDRFAFDMEAIMLAERLGISFIEIPVTVKNHGESKVSVLRDTPKMLRDLLKMKRRIRRMNIQKLEEK